MSFCFGTKVAVVKDKCRHEIISISVSSGGLCRETVDYDVAHFPSCLCVPVHLRRLFSNCDSKKEVEKKRQDMFVYRDPNN